MSGRFGVGAAPDSQAETANVNTAKAATTTIALSVESKELCVMIGVARLFFIIAFMSAAGNCSIELAEKEANTKAVSRQLTDAYYSCVRTSFASERPTTVVRNMAID
jgi:hypothetical protein